MKFFKFLKSKNKGVEIGTISDADIEKLSVMCQLCEPKISKKEGFSEKCYAYYVPQYEKDLEEMKAIFVKCGIPVHEHLSGILGSYKQKVLRVDYKEVKNQDKLKHEMRRIKERMFALFASGKWAEEQSKWAAKQEKTQR